MLTELFRTVAMSCATFFTFVWVYDKVVLEPLARAAMENIQEGGEMNGEEEKPLFIPFPGTTTQLPPQPYRGTDPEWQEFIKFSKDQAQAKRVRGKDDVQSLLGLLLTGIRGIGKLRLDFGRQTSHLEFAMRKRDEVKEVLAGCGFSSGCAA